MKPGYHPGESALNNVYHFLQLHLESRPDLEVFRWVTPQKTMEWVKNPATPLEHDSITVRGLAELVNRTAAGFEDLGLKKGDRAILFIPMSLPMYVAMFGLQKIGAIPVFLDSWARRDHLGVSAEIVAPKAFISVEKAFEYLAEVPQINDISLRVVAGPATKTYTARLEQLMQTPRLAETVAVEREHTGLITFTTGSSGKPKGANRTHRFLFAQHYALNPCIPYEPTDVDLPVFPIFSLNNFAAGVSTVIPAFDIGVPGPHDPQILLAQIQATGTTCITLSPSLFNRLSEYCLQNGIELGQLRRVVTGGAPVSRDNVISMQKVAPQAEVLILFGSTEVEPMAHIEGREMVSFESRASHDPEWVDEGVNVGHMADSLQYRFLKIQKGPVSVASKDDWKSLLVPQGEVGELIVAGEHVCRGYYNDEEAFVRAKILDENGEVWHRTGDLGRVDEHGCLWIVGRVHNAISRAGKYLFPVRAEMVLKKLSFVDKAAFLGVPDSSLGEKAIAVITLLEPGAGENPGLVDQATKEVRRIMDKNNIALDQVVVLDRIPMDPRHHSKVEYEVLRKRLVSEDLV
jgi:olefin beta-lactone synthetase